MGACIARCRRRRRCGECAILKSVIGKHGWVVVAVGLATLACERRGTSSQPPTDSAGADEGGGSVTERMRGQFVDGAALEDALVTGRVDVVNEVAAGFVERHQQEPFPEPWEARVEPLLDWARAAAEAKDFETAATAVANVSARCGECHRQEGIEIALPEPVEPDGAEQMQRYRFAVDRMWEGLVAPSDERWQLGAQAYGDAVDCRAIGPDKQVPKHHAAPCNTILAVAGAARSADTMQARADAFAAVSFNCAGCHGVGGSEKTHG